MASANRTGRAERSVNAYDKLLAWASEIGHGSWEGWRDACTYLDVEPTQAAGRLSALGHLEFDWVGNHFACAPPTAVLTLHSSGCVLVTGARRRAMRQHLEQLWADTRTSFDVYLHAALPQDAGPETWLIEAELADIARFCNAAGLELQVDSGRRIAAAMPIATLEAVAEQERPDGRFPRKWFDPRLSQVAAHVRHVLSSEDVGDGDGLWWVEKLDFRRDVAFVRRHGEWYRVPTREYGPYLAYPETEFISYSGKLEFMTVDNAAPLPPLLARALTLQSGRLPFPEGTSRHTYVNIDEELAELVQEKLDTPIEWRT
jgi:hypothetical protein